ncbi:M20/M25/M40 family metallo-hydrolase [Imperialibacter roseus]|uniref:M20/M25/M40 family metallo-hydrolase n=1 Tax=Imperialibacter roseus TaxID=1324217 RepID=A0ABZ0IUX1_9BACT|nr:M20/M25/M40 family metallo-hydrolase [Imperialibacter roseus]WOK07949.1 M20/M25/M40 family metallo-hydrolase [Imperialibacter roseus]
MTKSRFPAISAFCACLLIAANFQLAAQKGIDAAITEVLPATLKKHREFVSLPNVASDSDGIMKNYEWVKKELEQQKFTVKMLESSTLPLMLAERTVSKKAKTILFYLHIDGQPVNAANWDQEDPFTPVLKQLDSQGNWSTIDWKNLDGAIDPEWRIFGRAAADDKAPIMMMLTAVELLDKAKIKLGVNIKIIFDPQEEAGSEAFLSTLDQYKADYAADYMIIMDGPAHPTNQPTLTFGCRGNATCSITTYGAKLPQHSGHYGNYVPNPIFTLSHLLASMKDENGRVLVDGYYDGIEMTPTVTALLSQVPDDNEDIRKGLVIHEAEKVGNNYQEALQYPSLNVRHIDTSWKGPGLKTIIPEQVTAYIDVRLVAETDGGEQLEKIRKHIEKQGFLVLDRAPTDEERLTNQKIATFKTNGFVNAFRTDMEAPIGQKLRAAIAKEFGTPPVSIRTMGGTVPIIPAINTLGIPAIIVPMVNMDNNQHNPNENIRIGNISQGIKMCMAILTMEL